MQKNYKGGVVGGGGMGNRLTVLMGDRLLKHGAFCHDLCCGAFSTANPSLTAGNQSLVLTAEHPPTAAPTDIDAPGAAQERLG